VTRRRAGDYTAAGTVQQWARRAALLRVGVLRSPLFHVLMQPAKRRSIPDWQLPKGVTRALWEYASTEEIATHYDDYFAENSLFQFDQAVLERHFRRPGRLADLGCGTGRLLIPFARRGFSALAVDLSAEMLSVVREKARHQRLAIDCLRANLVELDCLADASCDYAIIMFSTLGMVQGSENRLAALAHVRRILRPGGLLVLHVHNLWYNLFDPQGRAWLLGNLWDSWRGRCQWGDKVGDYRGIPNMYLHVFRRGELRRLIRAAGFAIVEWIALDTVRRHPLKCPWFFERLRANGWIVVCSR
jgi:ubiquinone/menaquinone biosynthesis C-methylase UbiE